MSTQSNITVNGKPLEVHLNEEKSKEIQKHRSDEIASVTFRRSVKSKNSQTSHTHSSAGTVVYRTGQPETHVIIDGIMYPWAQKAPFVESDMSILGGLEYSDSLQKLKCHECGEWRTVIAGNHLKGVHGIDQREYKVRHGLFMRTRLISPSSHLLTGGKGRLIKGSGFSAESRAKGQETMKRRKEEAHNYPLSRAEAANLNAKCRAQLSVRLLDLYRELGETPTRSALLRHKLVPMGIERKFGMKLREVFLSLGMMPNKVGAYGGATPWRIHKERVSTGTLA